MKWPDFIIGQIIFDDFSQIVQRDDFRSDLYSLKEDLLQISYKNNYLLDTGWYPSFDPAGSFQVRVIENYDWDNPICFFNTHSVNETIEAIKNSQEFILEALENKT